MISGPLNQHLNMYCQDTITHRNVIASVSVVDHNHIATEVYSSSSLLRDYGMFKLRIGNKEEDSNSTRVMTLKKPQQQPTCSYDVHKQRDLSKRESLKRKTRSAVILPRRQLTSSTWSSSSEPGAAAESTSSSPTSAGTSASTGTKTSASRKRSSISQNDEIEDDNDSSYSPLSKRAATESIKRSFAIINEKVDINQIIQESRQSYLHSSFDCFNGGLYAEKPSWSQEEKDKLLELVNKYILGRGC